MHQEIIKSLAEKYDLTEKQIKEVIDSQGEMMIKSFRENKIVKLSSFGMFIPRETLREIRAKNKEENANKSI